jgi:hypothetical protein
MIGPVAESVDAARRVTGVMAKALDPNKGCDSTAIEVAAHALPRTLRRFKNAGIAPLHRRCIDQVEPKRLAEKKRRA